MITITQKENCCGCAACSAVCPSGAIEMAPDAEGFLYPKVDMAQCIHCALCERVCPMKPCERSDRTPEAWIVRNRNPEIVKDSTSGGAFSALAAEILRQDGVAFGAAFDEHFSVRHIAVEEESGLAKLRGSKFVQSDMRNVYGMVRQLLQDGRKVVFSGTPCQTEALRNYLGKDDPGLICIDFVCRGVMSPMLWERYIQEMAEKFHAPVSEARFRNKTYGYHSSTMMLRFENGKMYLKSGRIDPAMHAFVRDMASRPSCAHCPMKHCTHRSDLTMFDCKRYGEITGNADDDKGYTSLLVHTEKGRELLASAGQLECQRADFQKMLALDGVMICSSAVPHKNRDAFYHLLAAGSSVSGAVQRFLPVSWKDRLIEWAKKPLYQTGLIDLARKKKKKEIIQTQK